MKLIALLLAALFLLTGCSEMPLNISTQKSLAEYSFEELTFIGGCREFSDSGETFYYKGEITGNTARQLYEIVTAQMSQQIITGGNYTGFESLTIKTQDGGEFRCYYTFDNTEYSTSPSADEIDPGMPVENFVGTCFMVVGSSSRKYEIIDNETENHFNTLISEYLKAKYKPVSKLADNGRIILIRRRTNYAWGRVDNGVFMDDYGNWYSYDFSEKQYDDYLEALYESYENSEPFYKTTFDENDIASITQLIDEINPKAEIIEKHISYDAGQDSLYAVNSDYRLIQLCSKGDFNKTLDDSNAKRIVSMYNSISPSKY